MPQADNTKRDAEIYRLRLRGYSPEEIAGLYGLSPHTTASIISRVTAALHRTDPTASKLLELDRLDRLLKKAVVIADRRHLAVSHGRVIFDPTTNAPMIDDAPTLDAISSIIKIMDQRARYEGTYAPTNLNITTPPEPLSLELQELVNEAKARASNITTEQLDNYNDDDLELAESEDD